MPDAWYHHLLAPGTEVRLNLSEYGGRGLNVNLLLEDMNAVPGLVIGPARRDDPRRVTIGVEEFQAALLQLSHRMRSQAMAESTQFPMQDNGLVLRDPLKISRSIFPFLGLLFRCYFFDFRLGKLACSSVMMKAGSGHVSLPACLAKLPALRAATTFFKTSSLGPTS
jgi:hypothetical protein